MSSFKWYQIDQGELEHFLITENGENAEGMGLVVDIF